MKLRVDIRREIAQSVGDHRAIVQTTDAGSLSTFTDDRRLNDESNFYAGCDIVMVSGPDDNLNEVRYVQSSDFPTKTLTITPDWNVIPPLGSKAELFNMQGMGCSVPEYDSFINQALNEAAEFALVPTLVNLGVFVSASWGVMDYERIGWQQGLAIPPGIEMAGPIRYTLGGTVYYPPRENNWWVDDASRRVVITDDLAADADGATFSIAGWGPPGELATDQDGTDISTEWLYPRVRAMVYARMTEKGLFEHRGDITRELGLAQAAWRKLRPASFPPNTVRLW